MGRDRGDVGGPAERAIAAEALRAARGALAARLTDAFFARYPEWQARWGATGRRRCEEDALFHLDFLAGALLAGSPEGFAAYARWTAGMLGARGVPASCLVEHLALLEELAAEQPTIIAAAAPYLAAGRAACATPSPEAAPAAASPAEAVALAQQVFAQALLTGRRRGALRVAIGALDSGASLEEIYADVIQASLYEVGALWESNRISVAEEHMATATAQYVVAQLYARAPVVEPWRGRATITGVEGELHQVGANLVADILEQDGWDVRFLGTNAPIGAIVAAVQEHRPRLLGISATLLANVPAVRDLLVEVRRALGADAPQVILGGAAFRHSPALAAELGAAGYALEVRAARALARKLSGP